jgi:tRNA(fMet)-specific endonuclease VapC
LVVSLALDTNVVIELVRGKRGRVRERFSREMIGNQRLIVSVVVLHELLYGCERHHEPEGERRRVQEVLSGLEIEALDPADVAVAARLRAELRRQGRPIGAYDLLIAGQALARGWTVVTANTREFGRIDGLNVIDWTVPAD